MDCRGSCADESRCCAGPYQGYYQTPLMKQQCITSILVASALQSTGVNCNPAWLPLNGSTFLQYNSTTYNDDMAWAATWMYRYAVNSRASTAVRTLQHVVKD